MDTTNEKVNAELEFEQKRQEFQLHQDYIALLGTAGGRNVIWNILAMCAIFESPSDDTIVREVGHQDVGRKILDRIMNEDSNCFRLMWDEHVERSERLTKIKERMEDDD